MKLADITLRQNRWMLWGTLASLSAFQGFATDIYLPSFTAVAKQFNVTTYDVQLTLSTFMFGMAIGQLVWGSISDRLGRKLPVNLGMILFIASSIACAFAPNLTFLIIARFFQAFGGSAALTSVRAIVRDLYTGEEMARTMSAIMSIFMAAPILAPSLGALILNFSSWNWIFIVLALFGIIAFLNFSRFPETLPIENRRQGNFAQAFKDYGSILKTPDFIFAGMQSLTTTALLFTYVSLIPSVLMVEFNATPTQFSIFFGVNALAIIAGSQINRKILTKIKVDKALRNLLIFQVTMVAVLFAFAQTAPIIWVILPITMLIVGVNTSIGGNSATLAMAPFQTKAAQASALVGVIQGIAGASVAAIAAVIPGEPLHKMTTMMLTIALIAITVLAIRQRRIRRLA
ncbi:MAG: multidrug effflux MFS transporter [Micrococcales bacterium]